MYITSMCLVHTKVGKRGFVTEGCTRMSEIKAYVVSLLTYLSQLSPLDNTQMERYEILHVLKLFYITFRQHKLEHCIV